ncbi:YtxH domain-containing protein [Portibacter lacus]|uniref:YtxH domain-containing protein n=1 Tax=Portibacter lacus TaxID=1099794 RepID=A0AA37SLU2_9BACT|nr:YtxH domain-containing protein [Portibacter lacus]GLR15727.1 hypothetical protein GCM10007940_03420 [Portibacter lacus]
MSDNNNSGNNTNKFLFVAGIITGAAAAIYLNTPHGKKVRNAIVEKADEYKNTVSEKASEIATSSKNYAESAMKTASEKIDSVKESAKTALDSASSTITNVKDRFINKTEEAADAAEDFATDKASNLKSGVAKAKKKLNNGVKA